MSPLRAHATTLSAYAGDTTPQEAWKILTTDVKAQLIDVRTQPEWQFSGIPSLDGIGKQVVRLSLKLYPNFETNPDFLARLESAIPDRDAPVFFLCKTGGRSAEAAMMATQMGYKAAYNIVGGFEGELNQQRQRGQISGWKAASLPWEQA